MPKDVLQPLPSPPLGLSVQPLEPERFRLALSRWFREHARDLPWRGIRNPYATWLSEIMLQQTRVATVLERYSAFLQRFPTVDALAAAPEEAVLTLWSGLGYYRRARMLRRGAQFVVRELNGELPGTSAELRRLPGVGEYTAAAVASIAFGESIAVLDGNVERVLLRLLGLPESRSAATRARLMRTASELVPPKPGRRGQSNPAGDHNQAMMELGATVCLPRAPLCLQCPVVAFCSTRGVHTTPDRKQLLSRRVACLLATRKRGTRTEVLLEHRPADASLMPGMLELPPLPLETVGAREPVLRIRHSITNTNYYVEVFAESALDAVPDESPDAVPDESPDAAEADMPAEGMDTRPSSRPYDSRHDRSGERRNEDERNEDERNEDERNEDEEVYRAVGAEARRGFSLRANLPVAEADLEWVSTRRLGSIPLTGLARKVLQRLELMHTGAAKAAQPSRVSRPARS